MAFFDGRSEMKKTTVFVLLLFLLFRETMLLRFTGYTILSEGNWREDFLQGARIVVDYCWDTGLIVIVGYVLLLILCMNGFRPSKPNGPIEQKVSSSELDQAKHEEKQESERKKLSIS